jgi:hypothetical protein
LGERKRGEGNRIGIRIKIKIKKERVGEEERLAPRRGITPYRSLP